jgi:hypothetical protein
VKISKQWLSKYLTAVLALVLLLLAVRAVIQDEWSSAAVAAALSILMWDSHRRDRRARAQRLSKQRSATFESTPSRAGKGSLREVTIWLLALIITITLGVLVLANVLGSWALIVPPFLALGVTLLLYQAER